MELYLDQEDEMRTSSYLIKMCIRDRDGALLIITHSTRILESLHVDKTHVLVDGRLVAEGDGSLVDEINENGFEQFIACLLYTSPYRTTVHPNHLPRCTGTGRAVLTLSLIHI